MDQEPLGDAWVKNLHEWFNTMSREKLSQEEDLKLAFDCLDCQHLIRKLEKFFEFRGLTLQLFCFL